MRLRPTRVLLACFAVSACTVLEPVDLPPETARARITAPLWQTLDRGREDADWLVLLNDGREALDWRLQAIDAAVDSVDLQTFLWTPDAAGSAVVEHLLAAADRGVRIRILVDDSFLAGQDALVLHMQSHPNIEYRIYNPFQRRASSIAARQALNLAEFARLDHRMHNKSMIVDGAVAIVGGRNLADEYYGLHENTNFRDLELLVGGPVVEELSAAFARYWNNRWSIPVGQLSHVRPMAPDPTQLAADSVEIAALHAELTEPARLDAWLALRRRATSGEVTLLVDDPPRENPAAVADAPIQVAHALIRLFDEVEEELVIVSAYLIPTPHVEGAVDRAIGRGVRVRMLTNSISSNNHLSAHSAYRNHIDTLLGHGVELYEVRADAKDRHLYMAPPADQKGLALHAKALIVDDDQLFIGSANLDPRSLRINTEMGLLVRSPGLNRELRAALQPDFEAGNAWSLALDPRGQTQWISGETVLTAQPASSFMQRIEDWFFAHLPIEAEM